MKWVENSVLETGQAVLGFLDEYATDVGVFGKGIHRDELEAAVAALEAAGATQEAEKTAMTSLTKVKKERRRDLFVDHLRPIGAIATKLTKQGKSATPDIQKMRTPKSRVSDTTLRLKGLGLADVAEKYPEEYAAQQMPPDFARQARNATRAVQQVVDLRGLSVGSHVGATIAAAEQTKMVRDAIRVLDGLVSTRLRKIGRLDLLEAWKVVKRYPQKPGVKRRRKGTD